MPRAGPAGRRDHPGPVFGPFGTGPAHRRAGRGGGAPRVDRPALPDPRQSEQRPGARRGSGLLHQHGAASHSDRPRSGAATSPCDVQRGLGQDAAPGQALPCRIVVHGGLPPRRRRDGGAPSSGAGGADRRHRPDRVAAASSPRQYAEAEPRDDEVIRPLSVPTAPPAVWPSSSATWRPTAPW